MTAAAARLARFELRGLPTTPRLRLLSTDQTETLWQWTEPGEQLTPIDFTSAGEDLLKQWQPAFDRALAQRQPNATRLVLPLQIESDAPCRVLVQEPNLGFQLESSLVGEPVSWTFDGTSEQTQSLPLDKPAGLPQRLKVEATVAVKAPAPEGTLPALASDPQRLGTKLEAGEGLSIVLEANQPRRLLGIAIAWHPLSEHTAVRVQLLPESGGQPAGTRLVEARAEVDLSEAGWLQLRWPDVELQSGRYWLHLQVEDGLGLWLGQPTGAAQAVCRQNADGSSEAVMLPLHLLFQLQEPSLRLPTASPSLKIALNGVPLALSRPRPGVLLADLDPVSGFLATAAEWQLAVKAAHPLRLTIRAAKLICSFNESL